MAPPLTSACARWPLGVAPNRPLAFAWPLALGGLFLLVFALVTLSGPGRIDIVDGQTRYEVARSLVEHGDSVVRDDGAWFAVYKGRDGNNYTAYRLPHSALGVAAILAADATGPVSETRRQFFFALLSPCMAGLLAVVYALWFRRLGHGPGASLAWAAGGIFCTPNWYYGTSTFDDILGTTAVVLAVAVAWMSRERRPVLGAAVAGLVMAWAVNCKPPLALFALTVLAAGYRPDTPWRRQLLPAGLVCLGLVLGAWFGKAYHAYKFPPGTSDVFQEYERLYGPYMTYNPLPGLASLAMSPSCGVLWYCPTLFLACHGWCAWRPRQRWFCLAVLVPSLLFALSISFLPYFKGDPCWGPRYMTPVFALWWVFVPSALERIGRSKARFVLGLGLAVQLLALSVDPIRLFVRTPLVWDYYNYSPWLGFDTAIADLAQRPRDLAEVLTPDDAPAPEFSAGPVATHAGCFSPAPLLVTSLVGVMATPMGPAPLNVVASIWPTAAVQWPLCAHMALKHYHIFNAPRPWIFSQWYLAEPARPVALGRTIVLLAGLGAAGLLLMLAGSRAACRAQRPGVRPRDPPLLPEAARQAAAGAPCSG